MADTNPNHILLDELWHNKALAESKQKIDVLESELSVCREREGRMRGLMEAAQVSIAELNGLDIDFRVAKRLSAVYNEFAAALASSAPLAESPRFVATPAGQNKNPEWMNATVQHENAANQPSQVVATPDLVEQAKIYFQREYDRDRTQSIFVGMAKFAAMHAASLEARVAELDKHCTNFSAAIMEYENDEASVCPEDVGFVEFIGVLRKQLAAAEARVRTLEQVKP